MAQEEDGARQSMMEGLRDSARMINNELAQSPLSLSGEIEPTQSSPELFAAAPQLEPPELAPPQLSLPPPPPSIAPPAPPQRTVNNSLRNNNQSDQINKKSGDKGQEFGDALRLMALNGHFHDGLRLDVASIPKDFANPSKVKHCLTVAEFAGDPNDLTILKTETDPSQLRTASSNIRTSVARMLSAWEGPPKKGSRTKGTTILGFSKRIMTYRNRGIKVAKKLPTNTNPESVALISLDELQRLEAGQG